MNGILSEWRELFGSAAGRSPRTSFWLGFAFLFMLSVLYEALTYGNPLKLLTFWFVYPLLWWAAACVVSKRLHDRGRSGWWAALVLVAFALVWPNTHGVWTVFGVAVLVWTLIELGIMPGEPGANRYGSSPRAEPAGA
jgi:uncharacterized membrane protein YhaH (DUF805 family)